MATEHGEGIELDPTLTAFSLAWDAYARASEAITKTEEALEELRQQDYDPTLSAYTESWDRHAGLCRVNKEMAAEDGSPRRPMV